MARRAGFGGGVGWEKSRVDQLPGVLQQESPAKTIKNLSFPSIKTLFIIVLLCVNMFLSWGLRATGSIDWSLRATSFGQEQVPHAPHEKDYQALCAQNTSKPIQSSPIATRPSTAQKTKKEREAT